MRSQRMHNHRISEGAAAYREVTRQLGRLVPAPVWGDLWAAYRDEWEEGVSDRETLTLELARAAARASSPSPEANPSKPLRLPVREELQALARAEYSAWHSADRADIQGFREARLRDYPQPRTVAALVATAALIPDALSEAYLARESGIAAPQVGPMLAELRQLMTALSADYGWDELAAGEFVLTGALPPPPMPLARIRRGDGPPEFARVMLEFDLGMDAGALGDWLKCLQREHGLRPKRPLQEKTLRLFLFVVRQWRAAQQRGERLPRISHLLRRWNGESPAAERYKELSHFTAAFERVRARFMPRG